MAAATDAPYQRLHEAENEEEIPPAPPATVSSDATEESQSRSVWSRIRQGVRKNWTLFVVKPVLIFYGLQYAITGSITTQLWIDRTCRITFNYNDTVCSNLTDGTWKNIEVEVQKQVASYTVVNTYLSSIAPIVLALYMGPKSDQGRKLLMYVPFSAHLFAGIVPMAVLYFPKCPPQALWLLNIYTLGGGFTVLSIALNGYLSDVTNQKNRTTLMAILSGLTILVMPMAEAVGGQIYKYQGYYAVYIASLGFTILGLLYILFIVPESVHNRRAQTGSSAAETFTFFYQLKALIAQGNENLASSLRCAFKPRQGKKKPVIITLLLVTVISALEMSSSTIGLLYAESKFQWSVVDYTNFTAFAFTVWGLRTFITTPILCYFLGIHDCMLAITGGLATISGDITTGLATKGWIMYLASGITLLGGVESTPLKSILSKCVDPDEYGKIFTLSAVASSVSSLLGGAILPKLYQAFVDTCPGAVYFFMAGFQGVAVIVMSALYMVIKRHEKVYGPLGKDQDDLKRLTEEASEQNHEESPNI